MTNLIRMKFSSHTLKTEEYTDRHFNVCCCYFLLQFRNGDELNILWQWIWMNRLFVLCWDLCTGGAAGCVQDVRGTLHHFLILIEFGSSRLTSIQQEDSSSHLSAQVCNKLAQIKVYSVAERKKKHLRNGKWQKSLLLWTACFSSNKVFSAK